MNFTRDIVELALMRRIARALEEANSIARYRAEREFPPLPTKPIERKRAVISRREEAGIGSAQIHEGLS